MENSHSWAEFAKQTVSERLKPPLPAVLKVVQEGSPPRFKTALELGCGAGNDVLALLERGWQVTALDHDRAVLDLLRDRAAAHVADHVAALTLVEGQFDQFPRRRYGLVYARLSLPFATPEVWQRAWRRIGRSVAVNGVVAAVLFGLDDQLLSPERRVLVSLEEAAQLLPDTFTMVSLDEFKGETTRARGGTYHGHQVVLIARRTGPA